MAKGNKKITIDDLAQMTKKGFDEVYERMDQKFVQNEMEHQEIKGEIHEIKGEIQEIKGEIHEIKGEIHEKFDEIMVGQDKIIGMLEDRKTEDAADLAAHYRFEEKLKDHEKRIETLETK